MKKAIAILLVAVVAAAILGGCAGGKLSDPQSASSGATRIDPQSSPQGEAESDPQSASSGATRIFTDSTGRKVEIPCDIRSVAASGTFAQIVLFALCPEKLAGVADAWDDSARGLIDRRYLELPVLGQIYGGKSVFDPELLLASDAEIVVDIGEAKGTASRDLDELQEQTGIPCVHISASLETMGDTYRRLGELFQMEREADVLAGYCDRIYGEMTEFAQKIQKVNALFITGPKGQNVIAAGSYHAEVFDLLTNNLAVVDSPSAKGTGNEVDMEQILGWNPECIVFAPDSIYGEVRDDPVWSSVRAVKNGKLYEVPCGPVNWMGFPPSVQRYLGMMWLAGTLYPDDVPFDLAARVKEYFELFFHCELTDGRLEGLLHP